jgi:hypothetical protein
MPIFLWEMALVITKANYKQLIFLKCEKGIG